VSYEYENICDNLPFDDSVFPFMTLNVWSGLDYKGTLIMGEYEPPEVRETRFQALLKEIRSLSPDIIAVNEANFLPDYIERLSGELNYNYIFHVGISGLHVWRIGLPWNLKEGDAILARKDLGLQCVGRKQLSGGGFVWNNFSFHTQDATQVLVGKITLNGNEVYLAVTHWHASPKDDESIKKLLSKLKEKWGYTDEAYRSALEKLKSDNEWRMDEAKRMMSYLKEVVPSGAPLIVMGDFNAELDWPEMRYFLEAGFYDTYSVASRDKGYTWDAERNYNIKKFYGGDRERKHESLYDHLNAHNEFIRKRIDFILNSVTIPRESVVTSRVCADVLYEGVHPSDHFGVFTVLRLPLQKVNR
jgi:endonuclease/exonuclease/phosphatase family metal-dependent hydrolase